MVQANARPLKSAKLFPTTRLVALNRERAAEEKRGLTRWLRPDYQNPVKSSDGRGSAYAERRPPLQRDLAGTETSSKSTINNQQSTLNNRKSNRFTRIP